LPFAWLGFAPALCAHSQYVVDRLLRSHEDIAQTAPVIGTIVLDSSLQYWCEPSFSRFHAQPRFRCHVCALVTHAALPSLRPSNSVSNG
jgi:hypothetical protein